MSGRYFDENDALTSDYSRVVRTFIPGYDAVHDLVTVLLAEVGDAGTLLVVGAGGGNELVRFASALPAWRFVAVDPSEVMLAQARERIEHAGMSDRVVYTEGVSLDAPRGPFDAATALLALVFAADDGQRLAQLAAVHARLRPGAPFVMLHAAVDPATFERDLARYAAHARLRGASDEMLDEAIAMQRSGIHILSPARELELLREAGFHAIELTYRAGWIHGWVATA